MKARLCEICLKNPAFGVACTSIPYSCSYCVECVKQSADPEWIFIYLLEEEANYDPFKIVGKLVTYYDNAYISFHEWAKIRLSTKF